MAMIQQILENPVATMDSWGLPQQEARLKLVKHVAHSSITLTQAEKIVNQCDLTHLQCEEGTVLHVITRIDYSEGLSNIAKAIFIEDADLYKQNDSKDRSCLHLAAELGSQEWIDFFLARKMKKNIKTVSGDTLLHLACKGSATEVVIGKLSEQKNERNSSGQTPLHLLVGNTKIKDQDIHVRCVERLTSDQEALIKTDSKGHTPLHTAMLYGHYHLLDYLCATTIDYLELAKLTKNPKIIQWCLKKHSPDQRPFETALEHCLDNVAAILYTGKSTSNTIFLAAVAKGMKELTLAMLEAQAYSPKAYHGAAQRGWCDVLKRLESMRRQRMPWYERFAEDARWAFGRSPPWDVPINAKRPLDLATDELTRSYLKSLGCHSDLEDDWYMIKGETLDDGWAEISKD